MRSFSFHKIRLIAIGLFCFWSASILEAKVKLPVLISDGMVLQRSQTLKIWGTADAGENVQLSFQKNSLPTTVDGKKLKNVYTVTADANGKWVIELPPLKAGGPYAMQINDIEVKNILIGDVWLCSGQSNMELQIRRVADLFADEVAAYDNDMIRYFVVPKVSNVHTPQEDIELSPFPGPPGPPGNDQLTQWNAVEHENVSEFSALSYFFGKEMYEKEHIPIGMINSSKGGTAIESWISEEGLKEFPIYINSLRLNEDDALTRRMMEAGGPLFRRWNEILYQNDAGLHEATPWYSKEYDDSRWQEVNMFDLSWGNNGLNPIGGSHWLRKDVEVPENWSGKEATLRLGCIVDADSVYVNGVFVGNTTYQYPPRIYKIPAGLLQPGKNNVTVRIITNGGQPSFVKEKPYKIICIPEAGKPAEEVSLEPMWKYHLGTPMFNVPGMAPMSNVPVGLYNAMISPLKNCSFSGVLWYQGESNVDRRNEYADLLTAMIADWRRTFNSEELPFYIIELADFLPFEDIEGRKAWAEIREAQAKAAEMNANAYLIKNSDLGEWNDIHPLDKKTLAKRIVDAVVKNKK